MGEPPRSAPGLSVLLVVAPVANRVFGAAAVQARHTAQALRECGVRADLAVSERPDPRGYDLVHVLGSADPRALARQLDACDRAELPVALSPIWNTWRDIVARAVAAAERLRFAAPGARTDAALERIRVSPEHKLLRRREIAQFDALETAQAKLMRAVAVMLPASAAEVRELWSRLKVGDVPFVIVPNGGQVDAVPAWAQQRAGVVCAARLEPANNQHMLAYALHGTGVPLTFVGDVGNERYFALVEKWAGDTARFIGRLEPKDLSDALGRAAVHALPSWGEAGGLVHVDAAAAGARLVVGNRCFDWEWLRGDAAYADPSDPTAIREAVLDALGKPPRSVGDALDRRVQTLTWRAAAQETLRAYEIALRPRAAA